MQASPDVLSKLSSDIDRDAGKVQDFFVRMLRINAVNPRMGGPGEIDRVDFIQSFLEGEGFEVSRVSALIASGERIEATTVGRSA